MQSLTCDVSSRIILKRISTTIDKIIHHEQEGYRSDKSCVDHIFTCDIFWNRDRVKYNLYFEKPVAVFTAKYCRCYHDTLHRDVVSSYA